MLSSRVPRACSNITAMDGALHYRVPAKSEGPLTKRFA